MDKVVTKKRFQHHFEYDWIKYILIVLLSVVLWVTLYSVTSTLRHWEKIDIACYYTPAITAEMGKKTSDLRTTMFGEDTVVKKVTYTEFNDEKHGYMFDQYVPTSDMTAMSIKNVEQTMYVLQDYFFRFDEITQAYPNDREWADAIDYLDRIGALYRYRLSEKILDQYETEEGKDVIRDMAAPYEGQVMGIWLNKLPRAENGCFFEFENVTKDEEGNDVTPRRNDYVLMLNKVNLSKKSGGGNKGVFNAEGQDPARTETFEFIKFLFREDPTREGFQYVDRFIVTL